MAAVIAAAALMPARAEAVIILTPADADSSLTISPPGNCEPGCVEDAFGVTGLELLYKADQGGGDSGDFAASYTTIFSPADDPEDATITYDGAPDPTISCPSCYLAVKDGRATPTYYFFDISGWDGVETIELRDFWPGKGAISHVSIWGTEGDGGGGDTVVPEPASLLLLGLGALVAGNRARRRFAR